MSDADTARPQSTRLTVKRIVEDTSSTAGRAFALTIQGLILLSVVTFSIETLPGLSPAVRTGLFVVEAAIVLIFTLYSRSCHSTSRLPLIYGRFASSDSCDCSAF